MLVRWHMVVFGAIDGFSRLSVALSSSDNNTAPTLLQFFTEAVSRFGLPSRVSSDKGLENVLIADYMIEKRGAGRCIMITGKTTHNRGCLVMVAMSATNLFLFVASSGI